MSYLGGSNRSPEVRFPKEALIQDALANRARLVGGNVGQVKTDTEIRQLAG